MRYIIFIFLLNASVFFGQDIRILNFQELEDQYLVQGNEAVLVNFWATWCKPCVEELPLFSQLKKEKEELSILFVSLDFPDQVDTKLKAFLKKNSLPGEVVVLDDPNANAWINSVHPSWSGAIPATLFIGDKYRLFHEGKFSNYLELSRFISLENNISGD
jgi:thiol-disulfide isomerase/thioredoxin